jgi:hypothetical protein
MSYINNLENAIKASFFNADNNSTKLSEEIFKLEGMTGRKTRILYNSLLEEISKFTDVRYLEIGAWYGSSTCSALYKNKIKYCTIIDMWNEFGGNKDLLSSNINNFCGSGLQGSGSGINFKIIDGDSFNQTNIQTAKETGLYNVYLYDGCHKPESHVKALTDYIDLMDDIFIYIVDDLNWPVHVYKPTYEAFKKLNLKVLYKNEVFTNYDKERHSSYWNGVGIYVLQK